MGRLLELAYEYLTLCRPKMHLRFRPLLELALPNRTNLLYNSTKDLSPCLKQCFLHFSLKPKKSILGDSNLVGMWNGEGFVHGNGDKLEEIGHGYHKKLILRNLIEPDTEYTGQHICNMHDVVRSFAQFVARDEALVAHSGETVNSKLSLQRFLRLSIETEGVESDEFEWRNLQEQKSLRSLILKGNFKIQSGDSLSTFSSLRILYVESTNFVALVESLYLLKHLRYLTVKNYNDIKSLPENIFKMKFLQHIDLAGCQNLVKLPDSTVKLGELRYLGLNDTSVNSIPRGFCALTNLRSLDGFPAHMDGDWCSLEELGPLSQLTLHELSSLENVLAPSSVAKARLGTKVHLSLMSLKCSARLGDDGLVKGVVLEEVQRVIKEVFDELCPPPCIENLVIEGYFGSEVPRWMMSTAIVPLKSLKFLRMWDLHCCPQLPNGLCQLPCLEFVCVSRTPAIKRVGPEFVQPYSHLQHPSSPPPPPGFPRLHELFLTKMVEWEKWEWEEQVQAMPVLEELFIESCKLRRIPAGLASHARALKKLTIWSVQCLPSLDNFVSVVELDLYDLLELTRISNFPKLQKLGIDRCPKLESLLEMATLRRLLLTVFYSEKQLPLYLQTVNPSHLLLECSPKVLSSIAAGQSGPEWDKFSHIKQVEAYANDDGVEKKWRLVYTSEPYNMETNIELNYLQDQSDDGEDENDDDDKEE